jgi:hypothetical protein
MNQPPPPTAAAGDAAVFPQSPPLAPGETWLLASRQDRASCLLDKDGHEYFPHLLVLCSADTGKLLGMGSHATLSVATVAAFLAETAAAPLEGEPRRPSDLWLLSLRGELGNLVGALGVELQASGTSVQRKAATEEVNRMLSDLAALLAKQHAAKRSCHVCENEIEVDTDSRCAGCQAVYYCGRPCQVRDWKEGGHKTACARFKRDMLQRDALVAAVALPFAAETMAPTLTRADWVGWLVDNRLHCEGWWQRECGCYGRTPFGKLASETDSSGTPKPWVEYTGLPLSDLPKRRSWDAAVARPPLNGWAPYYSARGIDADSPIALLLHFVCTLYYCVHLLLPELLERPVTGPSPEPEPSPASAEGRAEASPTVVIHYLGPEKELDSLHLFGELALLLPQIQVRLVMVGPEVPEEMHGLRRAYRRENVPVAPGQEYTASVPGDVGVAPLPYCEVTTVRCLYHELDSMATSSKIPGLHDGDSRLKPRVVIGLNAGLSAYETYAPTVAVLARLLVKDKVPCLFTDYSNEAVRLARAVLSQGGFPSGRMLTAVPNPFFCPRNEKSSAAGYDVPSYSNGFLYGAHPAGTPSAWGAVD